MNRETRRHPVTGRYVCGRSRRPPDGLLRPAIRAAGRGNSIARCDTHVYPLGSATDGGVDYPDVGTDRDEHAAARDDQITNAHAGDLLPDDHDRWRAVLAGEPDGDTDATTDPATATGDSRVSDGGGDDPIRWALPAYLLFAADSNGD